MNNRQIVASLNDIANTLDNAGLHSEASSITKLMVKLSQKAQIQHNEKYFPDPTFTSEKLLQYVNEAMADHNDGKQGWAALRQKIRSERKFNKDPQTLKRAWQSASKLFQQRLDEVGGVKGTFKDDSGFNVGLGNGLPHKDRSPKPGGDYTTELPDSGPIPGGAYNIPSNRGMNVRPKYPVKQ
jgi:hypothetical protein